VGSPDLADKERAMVVVSSEAATARLLQLEHQAD